MPVFPRHLTGSKPLLARVSAKQYTIDELASTPTGEAIIKQPAVFEQTKSDLRENFGPWGRLQPPGIRAKNPETSAMDHVIFLTFSTTICTHHT